ncbi:MAG TPA: YceI family protein [Thermoanaerobaculia bacterium]|nr:YceI family protein [Thermoanaerobaculia bacterium]
MTPVTSRRHQGLQWLGMIAAAALIAALIATRGEAAVTTTLTITPQSVLLLNGRSNVADWRCSGQSMSGDAAVSAPLDQINSIIDRIEDGNVAVFGQDMSRATFPAPRFEMQIPVASFRCSGGRPMESDLKRALNAEQAPRILFRFRELLGPVHHDIDRNIYQAKIAGSLTLAGITREIEVTVTAQRISRTLFRIQAMLPLKMTQFGITPPTALLGIVRASDDLTVRFNVTLEAEGAGR